MTNIQKPVIVNVRELANLYGSHFSTANLSKRNKYDVGLFEKIGEKDKLNEWSHLYETEEEVNKAISSHFLNNAKRIENIREKKFGHPVIKFAASLTKIGFFSTLKKNIEEIDKAIEDNKSYAINPPADLERVYLDGQATIPKYMPEKNVDYYYLTYTNNKVKFHTVRVSDVSIYDYRGVTSNDPNSDKYGFKFSFYLEDTLKPDTGVSLDTDRLLNFDGVKWETSLHKSFLFINKKDAVDYAVKLVDETITKLETEIKALNELRDLFKE